MTTELNWNLRNSDVIGVDFQYQDIDYSKEIEKVEITRLDEIEYGWYWNYVNDSIITYNSFRKGEGYRTPLYLVVAIEHAKGWKEVMNLLEGEAYKEPIPWKLISENGFDDPIQLVLAALPIKIPLFPIEQM